MIKISDWGYNEQTKQVVKPKFLHNNIVYELGELLYSGISNDNDNGGIVLNDVIDSIDLNKEFVCVVFYNSERLRVFGHEDSLSINEMSQCYYLFTNETIENVGSSFSNYLAVNTMDCYFLKELD